MPDLNELEGVLLDYSQDKVAVLDETGEFRYVNDATRRILGYAPTDLVGTNAFQYIHPDDVEDVRAEFASVVGTDAYMDRLVEYRHRTASGDYRWLESRCSNYTDDDIGGYVVSSRDITDRIEAERERDTTHERLTELAGHTSDVLWVFSSDWDEVLFVNDAYESVYGGVADELEGNPGVFLDCIHPDDHECVLDAMDRLSEGESVDIEYRVNPARNYNTWVWVQGEPIFLNGEVVRIVGFSRDVTDRRRRERQLVVIDNILRHNLRNDMNTILGYVDLIETEPERAADHARVVRQVGQGILETAEKQREINELFTNSIRPKPLDLRTEIDTAVDAVVEAYPRAEIDTLVPEPLPASAVPQIDVAVTELLENAIKHAQVPEPQVEVDGGTQGSRAVIEVSDECPPIPKAEYDVLTGVSPMDQVYHSTGLGLWLAYWMIDLSDGTIEFTQRGDNGNTVRLSLPLPPDPVGGD